MIWKLIFVFLVVVAAPNHGICQTNQFDNLNGKATAINSADSNQEADSYQLRLDGLKGVVRLQRVEGTGILLVTGEFESDVITVEKLIRKLLDSSSDHQPETQRYAMKNAHAKWVASWAQHIYDRTYASLLGPVQINAYQQSEIWITGSPGAVQQASKLVKKMDR